MGDNILFFRFRQHLFKTIGNRPAAEPYKGFRHCPAVFSVHQQTAKAATCSLRLRRLRPTADIKANNLPIAGKKYFVFGTANFKSENPIPNVFEESNYQHVEEADFIYCGIPQLTNLDGTKRDSVALSDFVSSVKELVVSGKTLLCVNPDKRANEGGRFVVRQGSIAKLYEKLGG